MVFTLLTLVTESRIQVMWNFERFSTWLCDVGQQVIQNYPVVHRKAPQLFRLLNSDWAPHSCFLGFKEILHWCRWCFSMDCNGVVLPHLPPHTIHACLNTSWHIKQTTNTCHFEIPAQDTFSQWASWHKLKGLPQCKYINYLTTAVLSSFI